MRVRCVGGNGMGGDEDEGGGVGVGVGANINFVVSEIFKVPGSLNHSSPHSMFFGVNRYQFKENL